MHVCAHEWSLHWGNACVHVVNLSGVNARVCERVWDMRVPAKVHVGCEASVLGVCV